MINQTLGEPFILARVPSKDKTKGSCRSCIRPCISVGNGCEIAKMRILYGISFREAWERLTQCNFDNPSESAIFRTELTVDFYNIAPDI